MCARYVIDDDLNEKIASVFEKTDAPAYLGAAGFEDRTGGEEDRVSGDIYPSEAGLILEREADADNVSNIVLRPMKWGFPSYDKKGLIINARAENIEERRTFAKGIKNNRCLIPASGFYEWDEAREKVTFRERDGGLLFFGGIYDTFQGEERYVIITVDANDSVKPVHDRMPFILGLADFDSWFSADFKELFKKPMPELKEIRKYKQMSVFDVV